MIRPSLTTQPTGRATEPNTSNSEQLTDTLKTPISKTMKKNSEIYEKYFSDDDAEGQADKEAIIIPGTSNVIEPPKVKKTFVKPTPKNNTKLEQTPHSVENLPCRNNTSDENKGPTRSTPVSLNGPTNDTLKNSNHLQSTIINAEVSEELTVFVQSMQVKYELHVPLNCTIEQLINIIWEKINVTIERCRKESHILLLFTHRMHIFISDPKELVSEFIKLAPPKSHLYFYALKRNIQSDEMYTYETKPSNMFAFNTDWWNPVHFAEDAQLPRPQSILLSSLYALRLFFNK